MARFVKCPPASLREQARGERAESAPEIPAVSVEMDRLLTEGCRLVLPDRRCGIDWLFADATWLAYVWHTEDCQATIVMHSLLNAPEVPEPVIRHILHHELLHLRKPGRDVDGRWTSHPPEYWEELQRLSPEGPRVMCWLLASFGRVVRADHKNEGLRVLRRWRKMDEVEYVPWATLARNAISYATGRGRVL